MEDRQIGLLSFGGSNEQQTLRRSDKCQTAGPIEQAMLRAEGGRSE